MSDTIYWIWLAGRLGPGNRKLHYILDRFSTPYEVFRAESEEIDQLDISDKLKDALSDKNMKEAYAINDYCTSHNIGILTYSNEYYPSKLRGISNPPAVLYFRGQLPNTDDYVSIGVVGTRKMSEYGKRSAYKISYELASAGVTVVSGMALGIDGVAACAAIKAGGKTIAVLGSGVDVVYPHEHNKLYEEIIKNGAVISEYPPTTEPRGTHFPARNRIISGLTNGTLVIEGDLGSGALITADCAIEQGKDIFALPGNLDNKTAKGTNKLISDGAAIITKTEDILKNYEFYYGKTLNFLGFSMSRSRSELDENALASMGICRRGRALKEASLHEEERKIDKTNILRPRKLPKTKTTENMPSTIPKVKQNVEETKSERNISAEAELAALEDNEKEIFLAIPDDRAIGVDALMRLGYSCSEVMGTLAMLEIKGLVSSLPGGLYIKN